MIIFSTVLFLVINLQCLPARDVPKPPLEVTEGSEDYEVAANSQASLRCQAKYDKNPDLALSWKRNGENIDFENEPRFAIASDYSLTIQNVNELDSGTYTCVVQASATLIVQDVPNAPYMMDVQCYDKYAIVNWMPLGDNRAPILRYQIEYSTNSAPDSWETVNQVPPFDLSYNVTLSLRAIYTFRVVAINKIGSSQPSHHSTTCSTSPDVPYDNPYNVKGG